jgi:hypothetical protein
MQAGSSDLGNLPGTADGIGLHHHRRGDHQSQGEDATPTDHGTADDVGKEEHCGNQGSESGQLGGATQWGDDVAEERLRRSAEWLDRQSSPMIIAWSRRARA